MFDRRSYESGMKLLDQYLFIMQEIYKGHNLIILADYENFRLLEVSPHFHIEPSSQYCYYKYNRILLSGGIDILIITEAQAERLGVIL